MLYMDQFKVMTGGLTLGIPGETTGTTPTAPTGLTMTSTTVQPTETSTSTTQLLGAGIQAGPWTGPEPVKPLQTMFPATTPLTVAAAVADADAADAAAGSMRLQPTGGPTPGTAGETTGITLTTPIGPTTTSTTAL